jgi:SAM-dependent methyltransferase
LWRDYFPNAIVAGIDADLSAFQCDDVTRIEVFAGSQTDAELLHSTARAVAPDGFDLIIDDASHIGWQTEIAFRALFEHLRSGGWYVIEDWGTGYLQDWPDGRRAQMAGRAKAFVHRVARRMGIHLRQRSHEHGLVGFIKQLVDEQGTLARRSAFASMTITPGLVAVRKR